MNTATMSHEHDDSPLQWTIALYHRGSWRILATTHTWAETVAELGRLRRQHPGERMKIDQRQSERQEDSL